MTAETPTIVFPDPGYFTYYDFPGRDFFRWITPELALWLYATLLIAAFVAVIWRVSAAHETRHAGLYWACVLGALFFHAAYLDTLAEDSYITLRYVANALHGDGLVWNVGEAPIEGFSNFLYAIILIVLGAVGAPLADAARAVSLVATAGGLIYLHRLCLTLHVPRTLADFVPVLVVSHPSVAAYAGAGLETHLFSLLIVLTLKVYAENRMTSASAFAAGAWACRPDGVVVFSVLLAMEGRRAWTSGKIDRLLRLSLPFLLAVAALTSFRYAYFGDVIPNSVRAKVVTGAEVVFQGLTYVLSGIGTALTGVELLLVLAVVALDRLRWPLSILGPMFGTLGFAVLVQQWVQGRIYFPYARLMVSVMLVGALGLLATAVRRLPRAGLPTLLFCVSFTVVVVLAGGDWMWGERYMSPVLFLLPALAAALLSSCLATHLAGLRPLLLVAVIGLVGVRIHASTELHHVIRSAESDMQIFAAQGRVLRDLGLGDRTIALTSAGIQAFVFNGPVLDVCGLSNRALATLPAGPFTPGHSRCNDAAALEQRPDFFVAEWSGTPSPHHGDYRLILVGLQREHGVAYFELWARPDHFNSTVQLLRSRSLGQVPKDP